jgi:hypothetical protein
MVLRNLLSLCAIAIYSTTIAKEPVKGISASNTQQVFIENKGQVTDQFMNARPDVQYALHLKGVNAFIGKGQIHYQFSKMTLADAEAPGQGKKAKDMHAPKPAGPADMYRMDVELLGANKNARAEALDQTPYYENYYLPQCGKSGAQAHSFGRIVYHDVYPHIDWVLKIKEGQPEYEFVVKEGGNPADIRIKYSGATKLLINKDGSLTATTPMGTITETAPYSYQQDGRRINSSFRLNDEVLSFDIDAYSGVLTIDPSLVCGTYYGGTVSDIFNSITYDGAYLYMTGWCQSTANIATIGAYQTVYGGGNTDIMIVKMDTQMVNRLWATYYGGSGEDDVWAIQNDGGNNIYIVGYTESTNGISTASSFQQFFGGGTNDGFLAKFSSAGARVWATYYGGSGNDAVYGIDVDGAGKVNIACYVESSGLSTGGTYQTAYGGNGDALVAQFDNLGTRQWATYYGGTDGDGVNDICHNTSNEICVLGGSYSTSGIASLGAYQTVQAGNYDGFLVKFNSTGTTRLWGTYYGGSDDDVPGSVACDPSGNIYFVGYTASTSAVATPGSYQDVFGGGGYDGFLVKFNGSGVRQWATYMGGNDYDYSQSVAADAANVYVYGESFSDIGLATAGSYQEYNMSPGSYDNFLQKFDLSGNIQWGTYYGTVGMDYCGGNRGMSLGSTGNIYFAGSSDYSSGLATPGTYQLVNNSLGYYNGFAAKFNGCQSLAAPVISGFPIVCRNSTGTFTVNNIPTATTYYWSMPGGWSGTSNTNSITVTVDNTSGYLHVYATDGCGFSPIDSTYIQVPDPHVTIAANGPTTFCQGGDVLLDDTDPLNWGFYTYQWQQNNANIAAATFHNYDATASGNYRVIMSDAGCNDTSNTIAVTVNTTPTASITAGGPTTFCIGGNVVLSTPTGPGWTYQWKQNNLTIPSATNSSYTATAAGDYTVVTTLASCKDTSAPETVTVQNAAPQQLTNVNGPTSLCANMGTYTYSTNNNGDANYYTWTLPAGWTGSSNSTSISISTGTTGGNVTVTATNACGTTNPVSQYVDVTNANPVTTINNNVISTTTIFDSYQWYYNGNPIPGATGQSYTMVQYGTYSVMVTLNGCQGTSSTVQWPPLGVNLLAGNMVLQVFPNPNRGIFTLSGNINSTDTKMELVITDIAGRIVLKDAFAVSKGFVNKELILPANIPAGLYTLKAVTESSNMVAQFTKL